MYKEKGLLNKIALFVFVLLITYNALVYFNVLKMPQGERRHLQQSNVKNKLQNDENALVVKSISLDGIAISRSLAKFGIRANGIDVPYRYEAHFGVDLSLISISLDQKAFSATIRIPEPKMLYSSIVQTGRINKNDFLRPLSADAASELLNSVRQDLDKESQKDEKLLEDSKSALYAHLVSLYKDIMPKDDKGEYKIKIEYIYNKEDIQ